jgi:hypothetical protein
MFSPRALAAVCFVLIAAGCGPGQNGTPFVAPPTVGPSPTATPAGATPTPTATPVGATPTPASTPAGATPTPTPASTPVGATPTPAPTATPTPTPTPTPTATPTPGPAPVVPNPASLGLTGLGASFSGSVSATEAGYGGTFSETDSCAGIATVATASPTFTVTPVAVGTCSITILDSAQHTVAVPVSVTTSGLVVQKKGGRP